MKVCWFGFLGRNHSWSIVGQNISRELIRQGHEVDLFSTNGIDHFPKDLLPNLKGFVDLNTITKQEDLVIADQNIRKMLQAEYDMQLSYTALKNFDRYFNRGNKNRFGIWNYETTVIPKAFAKQAMLIDQFLPSSNFSKEVFEKNGIPASQMTVVPHGIHLERFENLGKYPLKTKKRFKILANIAQPHVRKNIKALLDSYGKAFTAKDDVCLILKISAKDPKNAFEVDARMHLKLFNEKYRQHAEVEVLDKFIVDIEPLYNACDAVFTMTRAECFWMPGLEGFAAKKLVIAPRYGGQLDYMNDDNSLLISGKEGFAGIEMQYWEPSPYAKAFNPDIDDAVAQLRLAASNYENLMARFLPNIESILPRYTWDNVAKQIVGLCK